MPPTSFPVPTSPSRYARRIFLICLIILLVPISGRAGQAIGAGPSAKAHKPVVGTVRYIYRGLSVQPPHKHASRGKVKQSLFSAYGLGTGKKQRASVRFQDGTLLHINQRTNLTLASAHVTYVRKGEVYQAIVPGSNHQVRTDAAVGAAIGTQFDVKIVKKRTIFIVLEGALLVRNGKGHVVVKNNQETVVPQGKAPTHPVHVNAAAATAWVNTIPPPDVPLPQDIALDTNGGYIAGASYTTPPSSPKSAYNVHYINDGRLDRGWGTQTASGDPSSVTVGFAANSLFLVSSVNIDPAANIAPAPSSDLKTFQIRVSTTGTSPASFGTVLTGTLKPQNSLQRFVLHTPVPARFLQLVVLSNQGNSRVTEVAELEVVGGPKPLPEVPATVTPTSIPTATAAPPPPPSATPTATRVQQAQPAARTAVPTSTPVRAAPPPAPHMTSTAVPQTCVPHSADPDSYTHSHVFASGGKTHPDTCKSKPIKTKTHP